MDGSEDVHSCLMVAFGEIKTNIPALLYQIRHQVRPSRLLYCLISDANNPELRHTILQRNVLEADDD